VRTYVYIDGFNLYYGSVRGTPYRWLNLRLLCEKLFPRHQIECIRYFTAIVNGTPDDPSKPQRQQTLSNNVYMPRVHRLPSQSRKIEVVKTEEKGSDVNLASLLLADGFRGHFEAAIVVSNDSDLMLPIQIVTQELSLPVGLLNPHERFSVQLSRVATFKKKIREGVLRDSQFPDTLVDRDGKELHKPEGW
jgi:hypothetical protein